ncbi:MAG: transketolase [bacterium]
MGNHRDTKEIARRIRYDIIMSVYNAASGHCGGSLSIADVLAVLYGEVLHHDPRNPNWTKRDRLILSKGHAAPALYAALAETGYFDRDILWTLRKFGSALQGHPCKIKGPPGLEMSTGSLGQGLSIAVGLAIGARILGERWRTYCILGDGELDEGSVWEAAMSAGHHKLDNLCAIVDNNGLQIDGECMDVMDLGSLDDKFRAFGWHVLRTDGHDLEAIVGAFADVENITSQPTAVLLSTMKGKGVSFMENRVEWHSKPLCEDDARKAVSELGFSWGELGGVS